MSSITGNITGENILIENLCVQGNINAKERLEIQDDGMVIGNIAAVDAIIEGKVCGDIYVKGCLTLGKGAVIKGNIAYNMLSAMSGAIIEGKLNAVYNMRENPFKEQKGQTL